MTGPDHVTSHDVHWTYSSPYLSRIAFPTYCLIMWLRPYIYVFISPSGSTTVIIQLQLQQLQRLQLQLSAISVITSTQVTICVLSIPLRFGVRKIHKHGRLHLVAESGDVRQQHRRRQVVDRPLRPYDHHKPQEQRLLRAHTAGEDETGVTLDVTPTSPFPISPFPAS